jgi:hypothetical protein
MLLHDFKKTNKKKKSLRNEMEWKNEEEEKLSQREMNEQL